MEVLNRRAFLRLASGASGVLLLAACAPKVVQETVIVKETVLVEQEAGTEAEIEAAAEDVVGDVEEVSSDGVMVGDVKVPPMAPAGSLSGVLNLWGWDEPVCEMFNEAFLDEYPDIEIKYNPSDVYTKLLAVVASGVGEVDVCWCDVHTYKQVASTGQLMDMGEHMAEYKPGIPDFLWQIGLWEGSLYGCIRRYSPMFLFYRTDIFEDAGITEPPATYDDYILAGKAIQEKNPDCWLDIYRDDGGEAFWYESMMAQGPNRWLFAAEEDVCTLGSPENLEALETYLKVVESGVVTAGKYWSPEWLDGLSIGEFAGIIGPYWLGQEPERYPDQKGLWKMAKIPALKAGGTQASDTRFSNFLLVPKVSQNPELAWEYIKYTVYNPTNEAIQNTIDFEWVIPSWNPMNEHPLGQRENPFFGQPVRSDAMKWSDGAQYLNMPPEFRDALKIEQVEVSEVLLGNKTPEEAMATAKGQIDELLAKRLG